MEAILLAAQQRLRPILMTSLATSLGALPIALGLGASSTSRIPLGIVVVGGIIFSLILTLFIIPAIYTFLSREHRAAITDPDGNPEPMPENIKIEEKQNPRIQPDKL